MLLGINHPQNGLENWLNKLKLLNEENNIHNVIFMGDSVTEGLNSTNETTMSYHGHIRSQFNGKYDHMGLGFNTPFHFALGTGSLWTNSEGWNNDPHGLVGRCSVTSTNGATMTTTFIGNGCNILFYTTPNTGTLTYSVDGADPVEINTTTTSTTPSKAYEITGLTEGTHTISLTKTGTTPIYLQGLYGVGGVRGVRCHLLARSATVAGDAVNDETLAIIDHLTPDLAVISYTANDFNNQTDLDEYEINLRVLIEKTLEHGDCLLTTIGVRNTSKTIPQSEYNNVIQSLSEEYGCGFFDLYTLWGGAAGANASGFLEGTVHLNNTGHMNIADSLLKILNPNFVRLKR